MSTGNDSDARPTERAARACAEWLAFCVRIGWRRDRLDALEAIWWRWHDESEESYDDQ